MKTHVIGFVSLVCAMSAFADTPKAPINPLPSPKTVVENVDGSKFPTAEKWSDKGKGVVCYAIEDKQENALSASISCVKVDSK